MKCFQNYKDDRICELCSISNNSEYIKCKQNHDDEIKLDKKLQNIKKKCSYCEECYEDGYCYDACTKGGYHGKWTPACYPSLECKQYCKK